MLPVYSVETGERASCRRHKAVRILVGYDGHPSSGFLASVMTEETGLGSSDCPWIIETQPGQRINLTLHNFAAVSPSSSLSATQSNSGSSPQRHESSRRRLEVCFEVAVVAEAAGDRRPVSMCSDAGGTADVADSVSRSQNVESVIAMSRSNEIRVEVVNRHILHTIGAFLIEFKGQQQIYSFNLTFLSQCFGSNLSRDFAAVTRTAKYTCFREISSFLPFREILQFSNLFIHFINMFPFCVF